MYCESKVSHVDHGDVEHILPKAPGLFPELEFEWDNLGFACRRCNSEKADKHFAAARFLNPYREDPSPHIFAYGTFLFARNGSVRGEATIREVGLNRPGLVEQRQERLRAIADALAAVFRIEDPEVRRAALRALRQEGSPEKEYSLAVGGLFEMHGDVIEQV